MEHSVRLEGRGRGREHQEVGLEVGWRQCLKRLPCHAKEFRFHPGQRREVGRR